MEREGVVPSADEDRQGCVDEHFLYDEINVSKTFKLSMSAATC
jgi:hypothetical protein